jgi:hypothetical protein
MKVYVALLSLFATGAAPKPRAGYEFFARTHAEGNLSRAVSMADSAVHGWAAGQAARIEITESRNPVLPVGALLLTTDGGLTAVIVSPRDRKARSWNVGAPGSRETPDRDAAMTTGSRVRNLKIEKLVDEPGSKLSGFATRHFRFRLSYVLSVDVMGDVTETSTTRVDELWTAPDVNLPGTSIWLRRDPPGTGDPESDRRIAAAYAPASGMLVKRVTASTLSGPSGETQSTKTVWEVSKLRTAAIPPGTFEPPAAALAGARKNQPKGEKP